MGGATNRTSNSTHTTTLTDRITRVEYRPLRAADCPCFTGTKPRGPRAAHEEDPDADPAMHGELGEFVIDPVSRGHGHGSRLLNAVVDTLLADGCRIARVWIRSADDGRSRRHRSRRQRQRCSHSPALDRVMAMPYRRRDEASDRDP